MFTKIFLVKFTLFWHTYKRKKALLYHKILLHLYFLRFLRFFPVLSSASPQVRLHPHNLLLLLPDDGAQAGQQGGLIAPGVWSHAVIQTWQLVQQRLLVLWTRQQLLLRLAVALQLWPGSIGGINYINYNLWLFVDQFFVCGCGFLFTTLQM